MLASKDIQSLVDLCTRIGNDVSADSGFVRIQRLLERFDISLVIRPLLVEGMLASIPARSTDVRKSKWAVLIDSESFDVEEKDIAMESEGRPLSPRFRNTIAHELVHSLAFRPSEFGMRFSQQEKDGVENSEVVKQIERETERLSPLLLWPEDDLVKLVSSRKKQISPSELATVASLKGVSRQAAINRLRLFKHARGAIYEPWLRNVAIGMAEWGHGKRAFFRKWPLFVNFDKNVIPSFIHRIVQEDKLSASEFFDSDFSMCGGSSSSISVLLEAGTAVVPDSEQFAAVVSIEEGSGRQGEEFLFIVQKTDLGLR